MCHGQVLEDTLDFVHKSIARKTRKKKLGMAEHVCNPSTWKVKAEKARVKGYPQLYSKLGANPGYMRP